MDLTFTTPRLVPTMTSFDSSRNPNQIPVSHRLSSLYLPKDLGRRHHTHSPNSVTFLLKFLPLNRLYPVMPSAPTSYLVIQAPACRISHAKMGLSSGNFCFILRSKPDLMDRTLPCTLFTAFSAAPWRVSDLSVPQGVAAIVHMAPLLSWSSSLCLWNLLAPKSMSPIWCGHRSSTRP